MISSTISRPKHQPIERIPMTYDEYLVYAPEKQIAEWVNGETLLMPPPSYEHQSLSGFLYELLGPFIRLFTFGRLIMAPFETRLPIVNTSRQPDLLIIKPDNLGELSSRRFTGAPDVATELVSQGSVREDRIRKFREYEQSGVKEYWLIDTRPRQRHAEFYSLNDEGIYEPIELTESGRFYSAALPGFWLDVTWLTAEELPNPQKCLADIVLAIPTLSKEIRTAYAGLRDLLA